MVEKKKEKSRQWDGVSRPSTNLYTENFKRIFGNKLKDSDHVATINTSCNNNTKVKNEKQKDKAKIKF
tara:strand:+ start:598 stop:801 length:204 start_codon:yes stop_codon:yes gene_type:complete